MTLTRIVASKNLDLLRYRGEQAIDAAADRTRARFATPGKHAIYADKRNEAIAYLVAAAAGDPIDMAQYPYLAAETGVTAPTTEALADLWIAMNAQWQMVAAALEQITIAAKAQVRAAASGAAIDAIVSATVAALDGIGTKPPEPPKLSA